MTRKDFELIARVLSDARNEALSTRVDSLREARLDMLDTLAYDFGHALHTTNERFDSGRFLRAAGAR